MFQGIQEVIIEINNVNDIKASSWVELPPKYKNSQSVINTENADHLCFLWCILAYLHPADDNKNTTSKYGMHIPTLCVEGLEFLLKVKDIPKFGRSAKMNTGGQQCFRTHCNSANNNPH